MKTRDPVSPESLSSKPPDSPDHTAQNLPIQMPVLGVIPQFTSEEISQLKALISERAPKSNWQRFGAWAARQTHHPLAIVVATFFLTGVGLTYLGNRYTVQQQELAAVRSFSDELNKLRIQKMGEVWEHLDEDEFMIDELIQEATDNKGPTTDKLNEVIKRLETDRALVSKYRFWLGKPIFDSANEYLNANIRYILRKLTGSSQEELKTYLEKRSAAKSDVEQVRERFASKSGLHVNE